MSAIAEAEWALGVEAAGGSLEDIAAPLMSSPAPSNHNDLSEPLHSRAV